MWVKHTISSTNPFVKHGLAYELLRDRAYAFDEPQRRDPARCNIALMAMVHRVMYGCDILKRIAIETVVRYWRM